MIALFQAVSIIKSLGGNVKMLVTNPKEEEEKKSEAEGAEMIKVSPQGWSKPPTQSVTWAQKVIFDVFQLQPHSSLAENPVHRLLDRLIIIKLYSEKSVLVMKFFI